MIALGVTHFRLSQFDVAENFVLHINLAKSLFERVRDSCSETVLTHYYVVSQGNLQNPMTNTDRTSRKV
jgi:hypothetical protein